MSEREQEKMRDDVDLLKEIGALRQQLQERDDQIAKLKRAVGGHQHARTVERAIRQIEASYDVSPVGADNGGFSSKLENYIHQIWKREPNVERLREALKKIADPPSDGCGCEHDTKDCCANVSDYHCPECIAWAALAAAGEPVR